MPSETTVAVFDTAAHAEAAIADLVAQGIPASSIEHYAQSGVPSGGTGSGMTGQGTTGQYASGTTGQPRGLWAWLTGETGGSGEHHALYDKTIETGGTVVTVISDTAQVDRVHAILEAHDPVDLDERHSQYGSSGAYGAMAAPTSTGAATTGMTGTGTTEALTLSEEQLQVGKRAVDRGTTRVRRYVVERPVEEQVRLRDETVSVFRRPVTAGSTVGVDAFTDRTITMNETDEEAVVAKTARVVEEVVVQKDVAERVETVRDTLRKEEVEIDDAAGPKHAATDTRSRMRPDQDRSPVGMHPRRPLP